MAPTPPVLIGADIEELLDNHFKVIAAEIPGILDLIERYTMRIARQEGAARDVLVGEFRERLLGQIRSRFTVVLASDERRLDKIA
ncbi:hypothetical protein [Nocardioides caricicola]|uniref:Uncharacterized protein n=1 Tax=Nocardioides caricicola TaxID=634770 RepID=A0ABW0N7E1_9ACTN